MNDRKGAGKSSHPKVWRFCVWKALSLLMCLASLSVLMFVVCMFVGDRVSSADDRQRWMVPQKALAGLYREKDSAGKDSGNSQDPSGWLASVPENPWQYIVIHHSATNTGSVDSIHTEHRQRVDSTGNPWLGIGYHFVIGNGGGMKDGAVEATFRWQEQLHGAHSGHAVFNSRGIGICLIGDFEKNAPTRAQMKSLAELVRVLAIRHRIERSNLVGHSSVKSTVCPGKHFPLNDLRKVIPESRS